MIFAETVLMNIKDQDGEVDPGADTVNECLQRDFNQIKETMTRCRFRMDISFLCLLINKLHFE